jgi:CDP-glucose 4,6-dehydratase
MVDSEYWRGRRVLLTGHTGFKGSWLLLWLQQLGAQVWGFALAPEAAPNLFRDLASARPPGPEHGWQHQEGDLADLDALEDLVHRCQPEVVLHLAAQPLVRRSCLDPMRTWATNLMGSLKVVEALRPLQHPCAVVMVTADKVYENREWHYGRETDHLGGHDPYSASKAAAELAIASWRSSFCGHDPHQTPHLAIATARADNVIGGGDWGAERIVPDAIRALAAGSSVPVRQPNAIRPWQHVLECLGGYLLLAEHLARGGDSAAEYASAFNFGPKTESKRSVRDLVEEALRHWPGSWRDCSDPHAPHEAGLLHLEISKAQQQLGWMPQWSFATTVERTVHWYRNVLAGTDQALHCCLADLEAYQDACTSTMATNS